MHEDLQLDLPDHQPAELMDHDIDALQLLVADEDEQGLCKTVTCTISCGKTGVQN